MLEVPYPFPNPAHYGGAMRRGQEHKRNTAPATPAAPTLSVVIPTLNAAATLPATLATVAWAAEIIVADGDSSDGTATVAAGLGATVVTSPRGRGPQLAAGATAAAHDWLLLLHADTRLSPDAEAVTRAHTRSHPDLAGYFRFALDSANRRARRLERLVAWRCRVLSLPYGDQGLLIHRALLQAVGGIRPLPLMEDVDLVRRLGRHRLTQLDAAAVTAAAKWERDGWRRRSARNLLCLGLWFAGVPPRRIAMLYR
ncbi:MAG TPA: TIGR04283 family arsenosugar biosynthesis glycosyltransferase [Acetobacteraceae bacterium]|nr:TIGR04283 family arsenosugar biosynthesis glycosyltransferase [Acetobacteraceae bacterium]